MAMTSWVRIFASIAMIVFAGAVTAGATGAFFSDTETSTGNTFTAGTLSLNLTGGDFTSTTTPFAVSNMLPGDTATKNGIFTVTNSAWFRASLNVTAASINANDVAFAGALTFSATLTDDLSNVIGLTQTASTTFRADTALDPARTYTLAVTATLPSGTGDAAQGGSAIADISLDVTQSANQVNPL